MASKIPFSFHGKAADICLTHFGPLGFETAAVTVDNDVNTYANAVLSGGTSFHKVDGFMPKVFSALAPYAIKFKVVGPPVQKYLVWIGTLLIVGYVFCVVAALSVPSFLVIRSGTVTVLYAREEPVRSPHADVTSATTGWNLWLKC